MDADVMCCFGCPFEGEIAEAVVLNGVTRFTALGVTAYSICDTTGMACRQHLHH